LYIKNAESEQNNEILNTQKVAKRNNVKSWDKIGYLVLKDMKKDSFDQICKIRNKDYYQVKEKYDKQKLKMQDSTSRVSLSILKSFGISRMNSFESAISKKSSQRVAEKNFVSAKWARSLKRSHSKRK